MTGSFCFLKGFYLIYTEIDLILESGSLWFWKEQKGEKLVYVMYVFLHLILKNRFCKTKNLQNLNGFLTILSSTYREIGGNFPISRYLMFAIYKLYATHNNYI